MQEKFSEFMEELNNWIDSFDGQKFKCVPEFNVPQVGRRADFLIYLPGKGLINIEAKCNNFKCMMQQLDDHARYCDYSFAFIPDFSLTPKWFKTELTEKGYGLIVYNLDKKIITEVLEAHVNKNIDRQLRRDMIYRIKTAKLKNVDDGQIKMEI
jgi:hypothetical protein